jgi:hypothetical protein
VNIARGHRHEGVQDEFLSSQRGDARAPASHQVQRQGEHEDSPDETGCRSLNQAPARQRHLPEEEDQQAGKEKDHIEKEITHQDPSILPLVSGRQADKDIYTQEGPLPLSWAGLEESGKALLSRVSQGN